VADGAAGGLKSGPTVQLDSTMASMVVGIGRHHLGVAGVPSRISGRYQACAGCEIRPHPTEQRVHLGGFGVGQSNLRLMLNSPGKLVDARNERQCLGSGRQKMGATVMRIRHARDKAVRLQSIEQANKCHRGDVETMSEGSLVDARRPLETDEDGAPRAAHPGKAGAHGFVAAPAPQPRGFVQQPGDRVRTRGPRFLRHATRYRGWPAGRDVLPQPADGRFVCPIALHKLLHHRLGQKLVEQKRVGRTLSHRLIQVGRGTRCGRTRSVTVPNRTRHNSTPSTCPTALPPADAFLKTMISGSTTTVAIINSL